MTKLTAEDLKTFKFDDPEIDNIEPFNAAARLNYINGKIRREDYLFIEEVLSFGRKFRNGVKAFIQAME